ncbi:FAD/NAD-P-binding domain-containing protein [Epithele typhae]|uniref:FAD/NAD-P-binding domain-containing protein n=1 Tax=Epithele typhae TaxID=378194 RepID=UPI0020072D80|nr:FAD/NAD-P-binding domain-containing protein [Epithele typhae]KAH9939779.1 FAD/NAD-P-binding domain-containing protein [Epithele typhae]
MSHAQRPRLSIGIVGAGLGGLLLALFLQREAPDLQVDIYESASELTELGVGIGLWPRSWEIIRELSLEDELRRISGATDGAVLPIHYRKADEPQQIEFYNLKPSLFTFHRSVLQRLLARHIRPSSRIRFHFSKRLVRYVEPSAPPSPSGAATPITLQFNDGTTARCDLLIGSDGIRSAVRRTMYTTCAVEAAVRGRDVEATTLRSMVDPVWSGQVAYRGIADGATVAQKGFKDVDTPLILMGKDKHIVSYPISRGEKVNVVAFVNFPGKVGTAYQGPWVAKATGKEVAAHYAAWDPSVPTLCRHLEDPLCWAVHTVRKLPTFVRGRVALIGDAAHAMTPHQGAGAGAALDDGYILAALLAAPRVDVHTLPHALAVYDAVRRPFAQDVHARSDANGRLYQLGAPGWEGVSAARSAAGGFPREKLVEVGKKVEEGLAWSLTGAGVAEERARAVRMLEERLRRGG